MPQYPLGALSARDRPSAWVRFEIHWVYQEWGGEAWSPGPVLETEANLGEPAQETQFRILHQCRGDIVENLHLFPQASGHGDLPTLYQNAWCQAPPTFRLFDRWSLLPPRGCWRHSGVICPGGDSEPTAHILISWSVDSWLQGKTPYFQVSSAASSPGRKGLTVFFLLVLADGEMLKWGCDGRYPQVGDRRPSPCKHLLMYFVWQTSWILYA